MEKLSVYVVQSNEMSTKCEINIRKKCGEKVVMFILDLLQNYTACVDTGLPLEDDHVMFIICRRFVNGLSA